MSRFTLSAIVIAAALLSGCGTVSPRAPRGWAELPANPSAEAIASDAGSDAQLQVIIGYGPVLWTHAALRLVCADGSTIYWDPGGAFGEEPGRFHRQRDVVFNPTPTTEDIWQYRRQLGNHALAVFEWDLPAADVERMRQLLIAGATTHEGRRIFDPDYRGGQCAEAISDFLRYHGPGTPPVNACYHYPHEFGEYLWTQSPSRVLVYKNDDTLTTYEARSPRLNQ